MKLKTNNLYRLKSLDEVSKILETTQSRYDSNEYRHFIEPLCDNIIIASIIHEGGDAIDIPLPQGTHNIHIDFIEEEVSSEDYPEYFL